MDSKIKGMLIASAVAGLLNCGGGNAQAPAPTTSATDAKTKCIGLNACKTQGVCAQAGHACGGQNECRGKGVTLLESPDACKAKGGTAL